MTELRVELQPAGQIQQRAQTELVARRGACEELAAVLVGAMRLDVEVDVRVAGDQPPVLARRECGEQLGALAATVVQVEGHDRKCDHAACGVERRRAELQRGESFVAVVEQRQVERQHVQRLPAIAELVREQVFGLEVLVAKQDRARVAARWSRFDQDVSFEPRRHAHCARYRAPSVVAGRDIPREPRGRLHFEAAEVVVLQLRADRQAQAVRESELILHEPADQMIARILRLDREHSLAAIAVVGVAIRQAPDDLVTPREQVAMLQIQVERIEIVVKARVIAMRPVVIGAQLQVRARRQLAPPAAEHVAAGRVYFEIARGAGPADDVDRRRELADVRAIHVGLQRQRIAAVRIPVRAETCMSDAPVVGARQHPDGKSRPGRSIGRTRERSLIRRTCRRSARPHWPPLRCRRSR